MEEQPYPWRKMQCLTYRISRRELNLYETLAYWKLWDSVKLLIILASLG